MSELTVVTYPDREKLMHYDTVLPKWERVIGSLARRRRMRTRRL